MAVQRIVLLKLHDAHSTDEGRAKFAAHTREVFAKIPGIAGFEVGLPADDHATGSWDVVIMVRFDSMEDVAAYAVEPTHREYVEGYLNPHAHVKKAWNFEI
ncbi:MAG: Dabb family protein [Bradymonadia bacterium]